MLYDFCFFDKKSLIIINLSNYFGESYKLMSNIFEKGKFKKELRYGFMLEFIFRVVIYILIKEFNLKFTSSAFYLFYDFLFSKLFYILIYSRRFL